MTNRRAYLRTRLLVAMVAIAVGVLVFTGLATLILSRRAAIDTTERDLQKKATRVAQGIEKFAQPAPAQPRLKQFIGVALRASGSSLVTITRNGQVLEGTSAVLTPVQSATDTAAVVELPRGVTASDLDTVALSQGREQTAVKGQLVFVAVPVAVNRGNGRTFVVVTAQQVERGVAGRAGPFFLFAAAVAIAAAALVAFFLARRLTRPLAAMGVTADRIARGDLGARVDIGSRPRDELADLASTLNAMAAQLEAARGAERAFLLSVSHDLRTPLTSIKGYAEAMTDGTLEAPDDRKRAAEVISAEARRLERLVADLLDLARLDTRQFSFRVRPFDAAEMVENAVAAFRPSAEDLGIALHVDTPGSIAADGDPERIGQIVANLVENAMKYATAAITVGAARDAGWLRISVQDDGPGIDPSDLPHVFDRLYTSRTPPGRKVGTGLGLAIVRELSARMGGRTVAERLESGGTRFTVHLPVLASHTADDPRPATPKLG